MYAREDVVALEHERQQAGARVVGVAPDPRAVASGSRSACSSTIGEAAHSAVRIERDRVEAAHLRRGVGLVGEVEVDLHGRGAQHHVEAARADGRHVRAHHVVALLRHPRDVGARAERAQADRRATRGRARCDAAPSSPTYARGRSTSSRSVDDRPRRELELAAGLDRELRVAALRARSCGRPRSPACRRAPRTSRAARRCRAGRRTAAPRRSRGTTPISSCSVPTRHCLARLAARREIREQIVASSGPEQHRVRRRDARRSGAL